MLGAELPAVNAANSICKARKTKRSARLTFSVKKLSRAGLEPTTYGLKVRCSTD